MELSILPDYNGLDSNAVIKVIGVGGGGGNAVNHMIQESQTTGYMTGVEFYVINTDAKALQKSLSPRTIQLGRSGLGAGGVPEVARKAAENDKDALRSMLEGANMVFIAAGMGGGTGTGAAPVVAQTAKELGILTVGVVTKPFSFEGNRRMFLAEKGIQEFSNYVDSLIVIPNDKLKKALGSKVTLIQAFAAVNDVLLNAVGGISDLITSPGLIGVDFEDVKTVMSVKGKAMMGTGIAKGESGSGRAEEAAREAISSPLLEDVNLSGTKGVLVNVSAGLDFGLEEFEIVGNMVKEFTAEDATVIVGTALLPELENEIRVTIVATGIGEESEPEVKIAPTQPDMNRGASQIPPRPAYTENTYVPPQQPAVAPTYSPEPIKPTTINSTSTFDPRRDLRTPTWVRNNENNQK